MPKIPLHRSTQVNSTLLVPLSSLASQQTKPIEGIMSCIRQFLDYRVSQEDEILTFHASEMVLTGNSDPSYLSTPNARSRAGGHFYLIMPSTIPTTAPSSTLHRSSKMSCRQLLRLNWVLSTLLQQMCIHPPNTGGNGTPTTGYTPSNRQCNSRRSHQQQDPKAMAICFYWLQDCKTLLQFCIY